MSNSSIDKIEKETKKKRKPFKDHHPLTRTAFTLSIIISIVSIIFGVVVSVTQKPGAIAIIIILAIFSAMGLIELIISSVSFRKGINVYNILGFIFSLNIMVSHVFAIALIATSGLT